jgi:hypothetical protein
VAWPSLLQSFNFSANSIVKDDSDKRHLTVKLGKTFPTKTTHIIGADYLGTYYTTDTSYAKPFAAIRFRISDSIGALITEASWFEPSNSDPDTFLLLFSEPVDNSLLIGNSVQLVNRDTILSLEVLHHELKGNEVKIITKNIGYNVGYGDSLRFNPEGPVRDKHGNKPHPKNLPAAIKIHEKPPQIIHSFYQDINADGTIDRVVVEFDKSVVIADLEGKFDIEKIQTSPVNDNNISYFEKNRSKVIFDLKNSTPKEMDGITSGIMKARITCKKFPEAEISDIVRDSAAPVLIKAYFSEGINEIGTSGVPDTLRVTFSESVKPVNATAPFIFKEHRKDLDPYSLSLENLHDENNTFTFLVTEINGSGYPSASDSVYIDPVKDIEDEKHGNKQLNPLNRRVLLKVRPITLKLRITAGPSPFDPESETFKIIVIPTIRTRTKITIQINIFIFDAVGNFLFSEFRESTNQISFAWNGRNQNERIIGSGPYLLLVKAVNKNSSETVTYKRIFTVKRQ